MKREIVLHTEKTGLSAENGDKIVAVGAVEMIDGKQTGKTFYAEINPLRSVPPFASDIHGLTDEILKDKPTFPQIAPSFLDFIGESILVVHYACFDMSFLNAELTAAGFAPIVEDRIVDILPIAKRLFPGERVPLWVLCEKFGISSKERTTAGALLDAQLLAEVYVCLREKELRNKKMTTHLSTGFKVLDAVTGGLNGGELVLIGGRPGMGKTSFALNLALNAANDLKGKGRSAVAFFSMEVPSLRLTKRYLSAITRIPSMTIIKGELSADEFQRIAKASENLEKMPLYIDDTPALSPADLRERCRRIKDDPEKGLGLVIIDYLQLIKNEKRSLILQRLKEIAKAFDVPIIVPTQLTRAPENRKDKRPRLTDIRDHKDLSAVDKVLFLYRENYYLNFDYPEQRENETDEAFNNRKNKWEKQLLNTEKNCEIIIAKNPSGDCGTINLHFEKMTGFFWD